MRIEFKIDQADIQRTLRRLNRYSGGVVEDVQRATAHAAIEVQKEARIMTPVDTGRLRASITVQRVGNSVSAFRSLTGRSAMITYQVGTNVEYAKPVEFGTQRQRPQPYLRPAYNIVIPEYKAALKRILRKAK